MTEWRCIPSCPQYEASDDGQVRRLGGHALAQHPGNRLGYLKVALWLDGHVAQRWLNRLVCEAFHGAPPSPDHEAAHNNGILLDYAASNLRWATKVENESDKVGHGTSNQGERNGMAVLSEAKIKEIRQRITELPTSSGGAKIKKGALAPLALEYGVAERTLRDIASFRRWRHI